MTKIIDITLGTPGDAVDSAGWIIVGYSAPAGGRTDIGVQVQAGMKWEEVAAALANNLGRNEWPQFIKGKASGNKVRLSVPDELDDTVFSAQFNPTLDQSVPHIDHPSFVQVAEEKF